MKDMKRTMLRTSVILLVLLVLLAGLAAVAAPANAAGYSVTVSGVVNYNGAPQGGATVTATHGTSAPVSTTTSESGAYTLTVTYPGDYEDTTVVAEYNGIAMSPVIGRDSLKMNQKQTLDFNLVTKGTPTPTYAPKPKENRFYIFTMVDGKAANGLPVTCTYAGNTYTVTSGDVDIEDADIPYSYHGPGGAIFYLPTGGDGTPKFKVDTAEYFGETSFGPFAEPFYKYGELHVTRRATATPTVTPVVSPAPGPLVQFQGYVTYNGLPASHANISVIYGGFTQNSFSGTEGWYDDTQTYFGGPAVVRVSYLGAAGEYTLIPGSNTRNRHDFALSGPAAPGARTLPTPIPGRYMIIGQVVINGTPMPGATVTTTYGGGATTTTDSNGNYTLVVSPGTGNATVYTYYMIGRYHHWGFNRTDSPNLTAGYDVLDIRNSDVNLGWYEFQGRVYLDGHPINNASVTSNYGSANVQYTVDDSEGPGFFRYQIVADLDRPVNLTAMYRDSLGINNTGYTIVTNPIEFANATAINNADIRIVGSNVTFVAPAPTNHTLVAITPTTTPFPGFETALLAIGGGIALSRLRRRA